MNFERRKVEYPHSPTDSLSLDGGDSLPNGFTDSHLNIPRINVIPEDEDDNHTAEADDGDIPQTNHAFLSSFLHPDSDHHDSASISPSQGRFSRLSASLQRLNSFRSPIPWKNFRRKVDASYGWVVVCAAFACSFIVDGVANSFGMYLIEFTDLYGEPESVTSWIGSLLVGIYLAMGPIACGLADSFGYRVVIVSGSLIAALGFGLSFFVTHVHFLFLTFGVIGGIGFGLIYSPSVMCVCSYFKEKCALAVGIAVCGSSVGGMVFPYVAQIVLNNYGWQGSMLVLSAVSLNCCIAGLLMKTVHVKSSSFPASRSSSSSVDVLNEQPSRGGKCCKPSPKLQQAIVDITSLGVYRVPTFLLYSVASFIGSIAFLTPSFFLPDFVIKTGLIDDKETATVIMTAVNGAGIVGRLFFGWLADKPNLDPLAVHNFCIFAAGLCLTVIPVLRSFEILVVDGVCYGFFIAPYISLMSIILTSRLGLNVLPSAFGQTQLLAGIASMIGPPLHGILKEVFDITIPFYFAGSAWLLASLISSIIFLLPRNRKSRKSKPKIVLNENGHYPHDAKGEAVCMVNQQSV